MRDSQEMWGVRMIKIGQKVRKQGNKEWYIVKKLFGDFAEVDKVNKNWIQRMSNMTEYVDLEKLEEVNEDITGGCTSNSRR